MIAKKLCVCLGLALILSFSTPTINFGQSVNDISLMTENYPPFNFIDNGKLQGISVDLMVSMLKKLNSEQSRDSIRLLPWARGYQNLLKKKNTCLFATTRTEEREKLFKWVGPISSTRISLIARKNKNVKIDSAKDISKYKIGVVRDDIGEQLLVSAGIELKKLDRIGGVNATLLSIKKLNADRIEVWSYEENVGKWEIKKYGFDLNEYEIVYTLKEGELYYAFHIDTPNSLIKGFQFGLDELKKDGTHKRILNKYLK
jgi:polar amino acid transport system substrate-binding protein